MVPSTLKLHQPTPYQHSYPTPKPCIFALPPPPAVKAWLAISCVRGISPQVTPLFHPSPSIPIQMIEITFSNVRLALQINSPNTTTYLQNFDN